MSLSKKYSGITGLDADDVFSFAFEDNKFIGYFKDSDGVPKVQSPTSAEAAIIKDSDELLSAFNIHVYGKDNVVDSVEFASEEQQEQYFVAQTRKQNNEQFINPDLTTSSFQVSTINNYLSGRRRTSARILTYPYDIDVQQDHLKITQFEYKRPDTTNVQASRPIGQSRKKGDSVKGAPYGRFQGGVILPMPKVSDSNGAEWGKSDLSVFGLGLASVLNDVQNTLTLKGLPSGGEGGQLTDLPKLDADSNADDRFTFIQSLAKRADNVAGTGKAALGVAAEQVGRLAGIDLSADEFLARTTGAILNPNAELLFQGPVLRDFAFKFLMIARSPEEGEVIRQIIRFFKLGAAPVFQNAALLKTPNVFQLEYKRGSSTLPTVNKFNEMALRTITVDYAPDGFWSAYQDSQPVAVVMNLQFSELRPIYRQDHTDYTGDLTVGY